MALADESNHASDVDTSKNLEDASKSNKPNQNLNNQDQEPGKETSQILALLQTVLENQTKAQTSANKLDTKVSNMENSISTLHNDIQKLKNINEEAINMAKQAITNSNEAQTKAEEAKEIATDNTHKINKA